MAYLNRKGRSQMLSLKTTKVVLHRELNDREALEHLNAAGGLAWVAPVTLPTSAFVASMALQRKVRTLSVLHRCREAYERGSNEILATRRYVPLDFSTIHIRVSADGSIQTFQTSTHNLVLSLRSQTD